MLIDQQKMRREYQGEDGKDNLLRHMLAWRRNILHSNCDGLCILGSSVKRNLFLKLAAQTIEEDDQFDSARFKEMHKSLNHFFKPLQ